jgi:hypothetical protein
MAYSADIAPKAGIIEGRMLGCNGFSSAAGAVLQQGGVEKEEGYEVRRSVGDTGRALTCGVGPTIRRMMPPCLMIHHNLANYYKY